MRDFIVIRPDLARFELRKTHAAWQDADRRFRAQIIGPHFESIARAWVTNHASEQTLGG